MKRVANQTAFFESHDRVLQNPYIGFTNFNHFRGALLFDETVLGADKEAYPDAQTYPHEGDAKGFHPACEVAYVRFLWRDFEPQEGVYDLAFVDRIFAQAAEKKQHLLLRFMPHTAIVEQDIPAWVGNYMELPPRATDHAQRVKPKDDPQDERYYQFVARAVRALGAHINGNPILYAMDVSLTGAWGEGDKLHETNPDWVKLITDAYEESFTQTYLLGQICAPELCLRANDRTPTGYRLDCLGDMVWHMEHYYPQNIAQMSELWKTAPISFEACWHMGHWYEQGWDIDWIIEKSLEWHVSTFNNKQTACPPEWREAVERWLTKMGYRFEIRRFTYPDCARAGDILALSLWVENSGVAPIYHEIPLYVRLKNEAHTVTVQTDVKIRSWMPGDTVDDFEVTLPTDLPVGTYEVQIGIGRDEYPACPAVLFATEAKQDGHFFCVGNVEIF